MLLLGRVTVRAALAIVAGALEATLPCGCSSTPVVTAAAMNDAGNEGLVSCQNDARVRAYVPGMVAEGVAGALRFRLLDSAPTPPGKGNNKLTFEVLTVAGASATVTLKTNLKMPDHGHPTPVLPTVTYDAGRYTLTPVFMFMPGVWRLDLSAYEGDDAGPPVDTAALFFCVEG